MPQLLASILALPALVLAITVCGDPLALSCAVVALGGLLFSGTTGPDGTYLDGMGGETPTVVDAVPVDAVLVRPISLRTIARTVASTERAYVDAVAGRLLSHVGPDLDALLAEITRLDAAIARAHASRHRARAASYQTRRDAAWSAYRTALSA